MNALSIPARVLRWLETWPPLRRLDRVPFGRALFFGLLLGLLTSTAILYLPAEARLAAAAVVIALAGAVAWSGQPVGIWETAEEVEPLLDMVAIEGGSFLMGSPWYEIGRDGDEKRHRVTVSAFRMARTTVTRAQYLEVMELEQAPGPGRDEHPVTEVSWLDAVAFCNRLSECEELTPCYRIDGDEVTWAEDAGGYRLPTETEWEYAARAGSKGRWPFWRWKLEHHAWFSGNSGGESQPVASLRPNPWGFYDMHGNVWEWCWDVYGPYAGGVWRRLTRFRAPNDPRGPSKAPGASRVLRGGAFDFGPGGLRSAVRARVEPGDSLRDFGFRCVRRARRQP